MQRARTLGGPPAWLSLFLVAIICAGAIILINPVGFMGGGQDDGRYVAAADCFVRKGFCLPDSHWAGRWPVFLPIGVTFEWLGRSRATAELWPAICSIAALFLIGKLAKSLGGQRAGILAIILLAATPAFSRQLVMPSVEAFELCMLFLASLMAVRWQRDGAMVWAFLGGIFVGLGFAARETAIAWAIMLAVAIYASGVRPNIRSILAVLAGAALPLLIEWAIYWAFAGDPFFRLKLSLGHGRIPSTELAGSVDVSKSPILNPDFIGGWRREPGIEIHWLIDGPLNLFVNALAGLAMLVVPPLLIWSRNHVDRDLWRKCLALAVGAAAQIFLINYVFAMDPKARVFLPALAFLMVAMAAIFVHLWNQGKARPIIATLLAAQVALGSLMLVGFNRPAEAQRIAEGWIASHPDAVESDSATMSALKLSHARDQLRPLGSGRPYVLLYTSSECHGWRSARKIPAAALSIEDAHSMSYFGQSSGLSAWICLFKYHQKIDPAKFRPERTNWRP